MMKKVVSTERAPAAIGPYSQCIVSGNAAYVSGQLPIDPETGAMPDDVGGQTRQSLENVKAVLEAAGSSMDLVLKATVLLTDMANFQEMNEVYASYFPQPCPARVCFAAAALPKGAKVEIDAIAELA